MNRKNKVIRNILLILIISFLVVWLVLQEDTKAIQQVLTNIKGEYLFLAFFLVFLWQYSVALLLRCFARIHQKKYSQKDGLLNALVAAFFHNITPGASGGQFAQIYVFNQQGISAGKAAGILWAEFIIYQSTMCVFGLLLILLRLPYFYHFSQLFLFVIIGFFLNSAIIIFLYALGRFKKFKQWCIEKGVVLFYRFRLIKDIDKTREKIRNEVEKFDIEAKMLKERKSLVVYSIFLCLLRLVAYYSIPYVLFISLGANASWSLFVDSLAMGSFVSIASGLIPIPGASGGSEALFMGMFSHFFDRPLAASAMLLWRFFTFYLLLPLGGLAFLYFKFLEKRSTK